MVSKNRKAVTFKIDRGMSKNEHGVKSTSVIDANMVLSKISPCNAFTAFAVFTFYIYDSVRF